jgi:hypothetical protein
MQFSLILLGLILPAISHATAPSSMKNPGADESPECLGIEIVVDLLRAAHTATEFCESVLAPKTTTTTTT